MKKRNVEIFLDDILNSIGKIESYIKDLDFDGFVEKDIAVDAVLRNMEVIGEAARNIPLEIREKYPEIPWKRMVGLRNIVIHEYFGVDLENIWKIVKDNLPEIKPGIETVLHDMEF